MIMWDGRIPENLRETARAFLKKVTRGRDLAIFDRCFKAASALASWQSWDQRWNLELLERAAHLNGEPERLNPSFMPNTIRNTKLSIMRGHDLGKVFIKAHRGLVENGWLKFYVESRIRPIERRFRLIQMTS